jgi:hypothetical protein
MGKINPPFPVKLIIGLIWGSPGENCLETTIKRLQSRFGPIDFRSEVIAFNFTDYYNKEFGNNLKRLFLGFQNLITPDKLASIKLFTNRLEAKFTKEGKRRVNIDPGYLDAARLILASTKDFCHRIYLGKGIYAEITLTFRKGMFCPGELTYPDFRDLRYIKILSQLRNLYLQQTRPTKTPSMPSR